MEPRMIARTWHGKVPRHKAAEYYRYVERTGLADYRATPGNRGVLVMRQDSGDITHFTITSLWDSLDAVKRFAGDDYGKAHYYAEDDAYLLEKEANVLHADVLYADFGRS